MKTNNVLPARGWLDSGVWRACLAAGYVLLAAVPVALAFALNPASGAPFMAQAGKGTALMGFALLALQVALSARLRFVDRPFGLDAVMAFHKGMAILAGILLALHPVLLAAGGYGWGLFSFGTSWRVNLGKIGFVLLALIIASAVLLKKLRFKYETWRFLHKGAIIVVGVGFVHGLAIGSDLGAAGMKVYWWLLLAMAAGLFSYRNVFVPLWGRRRFRVVSVTPETHDTFTVAMEPEDDRPLPHQPGQFMFLKLIRPGRTSEEHPFTISSSPAREWPLTATIKKSGDFTNTIDRTRPGDKARIEGPYGRFSFVHHDADSFVFIAGGVGVTPIMSMIRYLQDTADERPAVLIYGSRAERDIIFRDELAGLAPNVKVTHVLSEPGADWKGPRGYVTADIIKEHAGRLLGEAHVYVCGPPPMMDKVIQALRALGLEGRRIHFERFAI